MVDLCFYCDKMVEVSERSVPSGVEYICKLCGKVTDYDDDWYDDYDYDLDDEDWEDEKED